MKEISEIIHRNPKWYFGGCASAMSACLTHPLDLLKVHLQTAKSKNEFNLVKRTLKIIEVQGFTALYNGLTASLFRQATYSTTRFGLYEVFKQSLDDDSRNLSSSKKIGMAAVAGAIAGLLGTPGDVINVRMQNDIKLPLDMRRNYLHVFDGMSTIIRFEGVKALFSGYPMTMSRAVLMSVGQLSAYDEIKQLLLTKTPDGMLKDDTTTHMIASSLAAMIATTLTQPLDVVKTRMMNETVGTYKSIWDCAKSVRRDYGLIGFYRGYVPAFVRLGPHTMLTFVFLEQLRKRFGTPIYAKKAPSLDDIVDQ